MTSLFQILKASKIDPVSAPDMFTALMAKKLSGGGATEHEYTGAVPVEITADGSPLISWTIYGNMQQSTTPTPSAPIIPSETGERTVNLFNPTTVSNGYYVSDGNGELRVATNNVSSDYIEIEGNTDYYITLLPSGNWGAWYDSDKNYISGITGYNIRKSPANAKYARLTVSRNNNPDYATNFMIAKSSTAIPYEPFGYYLPILSGGVTTPVYLGEVQSERKIKKLVLTGNEAWQQHPNMTGLFMIDQTGYAKVNAVTICVCSHYQGSPNVSMYYDVPDKGTAFYAGATAGSNVYYIRDSSFSDAETFQSYLAAQYAAGTPVCVWYVLATPQTTTLNEPISKIGDYADSISDVASIPTTAGSQTFDVDTTLEPSQVSIRYKE